MTKSLNKFSYLLGCINDTQGTTTLEKFWYPPLNLKICIPRDVAILFPGIYSIYFRYAYGCIQEVHSCIIYNSSKLKATHMLISINMDEYILVDLYNVKVHGGKNEEIISIHKIYK